MPSATRPQVPDRGRRVHLVAAGVAGGKPAPRLEPELPAAVRPGETVAGQAHAEWSSGSEDVCRRWQCRAKRLSAAASQQGHGPSAAAPSHAATPLPSSPPALHCAAHAQPARLLPPAQLLHRLAAAAPQHHSVRREGSTLQCSAPSALVGHAWTTRLEAHALALRDGIIPGRWSALHRASCPQAAVPDCGAMGGRQPSRVPSYGCGRWAGTHCWHGGATCRLTRQEFSIEHVASPHFVQRPGLQHAASPRSVRYRPAGRQPGVFAPGVHRQRADHQRLSARRQAPARAAGDWTCMLACRW